MQQGAWGEKIKVPIQIKYCQGTVPFKNIALKKTIKEIQVHFRKFGK